MEPGEPVAEDSVGRGMALAIPQLRCVCPCKLDAILVFCGQIINIYSHSYEHCWRPGVAALALQVARCQDHTVTNLFKLLFVQLFII